MCAGFDLVQGHLHCFDLLARVGMRCIDHVQQQVGFGDLFQRGAEGRHQLRGQLLDETDRVGKQRPVPAGQLHPAGGRVERGEELVGDIHIRAAPGG